MVRFTCTLYSLPEINAMLCGLFCANIVQMRQHKMPLLYASGVRYKREPDGREEWKSARDVLRTKNGDCEDLAAFRAAELCFTGEDIRARPVLKSIRPGLIHCLVLRGNGTLEDPSAALGMRGKG